MKKYILFLITAVSCFGSSFSGTVIDMITREGLPGANVVILNASKGASCDVDGNFYIANIDDGTYRVVVSMIGYKTDTSTINIPKDVFKKIRLRQDIQLEQPVIVTANRMKQNLQESAVTTTVVDKTFIANTATNKMDQAIKAAPGVTVNRTSISLRNCSGFAYGAGMRVLVMVDGVPMLSGDTGEAKWDALPMSNVKQIELVKNAGSAQYGSSALGGVINIITEDPVQGVSYYVANDLGIYDQPHWKQWRWSDKTRMYNVLKLSNTYSADKLSISNHLTTTYDESFRQNDDSKRFSYTGKVKIAKTAREDFTINTNLSYEDHGTYLDWLSVERALEVDSTAWRDRVYSSKLSLSGIYNRRNLEKQKLVSIRGYTFINSWNDRAWMPEYSGFSHRSSASSKSAVDAQVNFSSNENYQLSTGAELTASTVKSTIFDNRLGMGGACYAESEYRGFNPFIVSLGLRGDLFSVVDGKTYYQANPKLGMVYHIKDNIALRSSFGTGFRVPTMAELFTETTVSGLINVLPNPDLKPEKSYSTEIGGNIITNHAILDVAVFSNWYNNLIEPQKVAGGTSASNAKFQNISQARVSGLEMSINLYWQRTTISANYLYTDSRDLDSLKALPYRPSNNFSVNCSYRYFKNMSLIASWRYKDKREYALFKDAPSVPEKILDLGHTADFGSNYINFKVNNAFNYIYS